MDSRDLASQVRRVSLVSKNGRAAGPLFFTVVPPPGESRSGSDVLRYFANSLRRDEVLERCARTSGASGKLSIQLLLPADGETNQDGVSRRISFRLGEALADGPAGRCIGEALAARAAAFELPAEVSRAEATRTFDLP